MSVVFHFARELQGIRNATQTNYRCRQHCEQPMTSRSIFFWRRRLAYRIKRASTFAGPCRNLPLRSQQNADWLLFRHGEYSPPSEYSEISSQNKMKNNTQRYFLPSYLPSSFFHSESRAGFRKIVKACEKNTMAPANSDGGRSRKLLKEKFRRPDDLTLPGSNLEQRSASCDTLSWAALPRVAP